MNLILPNVLKPYDLNFNDILEADEIAKIHNLPAAKLDKLTQDITYLLLREITAANKNARNKLVPSEGINFDEFRTLAFLAQAEKQSENRTVSQTDIAAELHLSTSTITNLLDKMDVARGLNASNNRGWITRLENPNYRKEKLVSLTDEGRARIRAARSDYKREASKGLLRSLACEDLVALLVNLLRFNVALDPKHDLNPDISDSDDSAGRAHSSESVAAA
jgi:DNA-binding MarR family transcriptional regulator